MANNPRLIDVSGRVFGMWTVLQKAGNKPRGAAVWKCACSCGKEALVTGSDLRSGKSTGCGCANKDRLGNLKRTHAGCGTRLHRIWKNMRSRCGNPNNPNFERYGGRGIFICEEWMDFSRFRDWAEASGYSDGLSIDRVDNNAGYSADNCRWADAKTQSRNRAYAKKAPDGRTWAEIAEANGVPARIMCNRVVAGGWDKETAATWPLGRPRIRRKRDGAGRYIKEPRRWRR